MVCKPRTNMAARGLIRKTLFLPNLVSRLQYCLFLPSKISIPQAISNEKCILLNRCARTWMKIVMLMSRSIVPAINPENGSKKLLFKFSSLFLLGQLHLRVFMVVFLYRLCCQQQQRKSEHYSRVFTFLRVELRALLSSGLPSRVRKVRSCKVKILICACNAR